MLPVYLSPGLVEAMQRTIGSQRECCGFLLGHRTEVVDFLSAGFPLEGDGRGCSAGFPLEDRAFVLPPIELLRAERLARQRRLEVIGVYHSHPSGNLGPSWKDHRGAVKDWLYLIVDGKYQLRIYRRDQQRFLAQAWLEVA